MSGRNVLSTGVHGKLLLTCGLSFLLGGCGSDGGGQSDGGSGSILVTVEFSGANFDQAEPRLVLDGTTTRTGVASGVTFNDVAPGNHEISLQGLHARCVRAGEASRTVSVTKGQTAEVRYAVNCRDVDQLAILVPRADSAELGSLQIVDADGQRQHEVFTPQGEVGLPAWSKDGRRLAIRYSDTEQAQDAIWTVNADGTQLRKILDSTYIPTEIRWSPDGTRLAVTVVYGPPSPSISYSRVVLVDPDGSDVTELQEINGFIGVAWAPDSSRLALTFRKRREFEAGPVGLYIVDGPGALGPQLTPQAMAPEWSPDGSLILFWYGQPATIHPDGTQLRELAVCSTPCQTGTPSWSSDGSRIVVSTPSDIRIVDLDAQVIGTPIPAVGHSAVLAPSSDYLAWLVEGSDTLKVAEADGTNERDVAVTGLSARGMGQYNAPAWRP